MPTKTLGIVFALLFLVVLTLGVMYFNVNKSPTQAPGQTQNQENADGTSPQAGTNAQPTAAAASAELTDKEKQVLNAPGENATQEEKDKHGVLLFSLSRESTTLDISSCEIPNPLVLRAKLGTEIKLVNNDSVAHVLTITGKAYAVEPKGSTTLKLDFGKGAGGFGYVCDSKGQGTPPVSGFFLLSQ
jgi:plastocyanin